MLSSGASGPYLKKKTRKPFHKLTVSAKLKYVFFHQLRGDISKTSMVLFLAQFYDKIELLMNTVPFIIKRTMNVVT